MAAYLSDDPKQLDELFKKDGEGYLLVGYETGKEKPHAESSYILYSADPDRQDPVYTFMALFSRETIKSQICRFCTGYPSGNLFIPENDGCACPYRGYCQERIYQPVLSALCP